MSASPTVLIMAAGHGTRMRSATAKVLHPVCGRPMVHWVIEAARRAGAGRVVCVTRPGEGVAGELPSGVDIAEQQTGEGTGSAVLAARGQIEPGSTVVVLSGDHPLIAAATIEALLAAHAQAAAAATLLTTDRIDPAGYGRIVRSEGGLVERIVETKSTEGVPASELAIREVNIGAYAFAADELLPALDAVGEVGGERYLTEVLPVMRGRGKPIAAHVTEDVASAIGVNTRAGLMEVERLAQRSLLEQHALAGVSFTAPDTVRVEVGVEIGEDSTIGPGVTLQGATRVGRACAVGPSSTLIDAWLGDGVSVVHSYLAGCEIAANASVGPFAYLRPGAIVGERAKVGTFVEVKGSTIGAGAKVPHLSYIGDAEIGEDANIAAGNITANYDGRAKHRTVIGARARTGVNSSFVAPVSVGEGAYTGAGSVITGDVPDGALGISRPEQRNVEGYADRVDRKSRA